MSINVNVGLEKDPDIQLAFKDASIRTVETTTTLSKFSVLIPIFSSYGDPNKVVKSNSYQEFINNHGDDVTHINKYGYNGMYAAHALKGGAEVWSCRLLPNDAKRATIMLKVAVKEDNDIPVFERNEDGSFALDDNGDRIPAMIPNPDEESADYMPLIRKTIEGFRLKWIVEEVTDERSAFNISKRDGWTIYPLMYFYALYASSSGNGYGLKIQNRYDRDEEVSDGRRYTLTFFRASSTGVIESYGVVYDFAFNPDAVVSKYAPDMFEGLQIVYGERDRNNGFIKRNIQLKYNSKNYIALLDHLDERFNSGTKWDIDILSCTDKYEIPYDELILDEANVSISDSVTFLEGGSNGSLEYGNIVQTVDGPKVVDYEYIEEVKLQLLKDFYNGKIDDSLEDCRKVSAGIVVDCNYPMEIKRILGNLLTVRDDMVVFFDCGITTNFDDCTRIINMIKSFIDNTEYGFRFAIFPHCGTPVDDTINMDYKVTQTYEAIYKIPLNYSRYGDFCPYAGIGAGLVETFIPDWYIANNTLKIRAKRLGVIYIVDYGNIGGSTALGIKPLWVDSDKTLYFEEYSVVKSLRTSLVVADFFRLVRTTLIKYRFGNAETNRIKAKTDLNQQITERYPDDYVIDLEMYQNDRDKVEGYNVIDATIKAADQSDKWRGTITVDRQD